MIPGASVSRQEDFFPRKTNRPREAPTAARVSTSPAGTRIAAAPRTTPTRALALFGLSSALVTVLLTGCRVGPTYVKPIAATPPAFKEADPNWQFAAPADSALKGDWWTVFNDPGLNALEPQVASANQTLAIAEANLRASRANIRVARSPLAPTVGIGPSIGSERLSANQPYGSSNNNRNSGVFNIQADLSYEIDFWGRIHRNLTAAQEETQASAADLQTALLSLQSELALDYFEARCADAQSKLLNDTVQQYTDALRITTNRFNGGVAPRSDVAQAQTQLQTAKVQASDVAIARAQFEHAIAVLIGKAPAAFSLPADPLHTVPPIVPAGLPSQLLERRPDIASAERHAAAANEQIGIARAAFFPTIGFSTAAGLVGSTPANLFRASSLVYSLGPALAQTFFDYGRRRGLSDEAVANYDAAAANYRQTVLDAYQQVEDNLVALRVLADEATQQHQATVSAQEAQQIFNNRYVGGVDTYLQVITAQTTALNNERNDIDIMRRRMDATVLLIKALGGGWTATQLPQNPQP
jgi:NodT family efflux transporter outer membrane factor (OMF) lipoprotein